MSLPGEIRVVDDVAAEFCRVVADAWAARPDRGFRMALSGGRTAARCYERLAIDPTIDWMVTELYWGDERCVPSDHPDSNYRLVVDHLLSRVGGVHALFPMRCDEADGYNLLLSGIGDLDVLHLGLGADAHTASLFPGADALDADPGRLVVTTRDPLGAHAHDRVTLTASGLARARTVVVTVSGAEKAEALAAVARGDDVPGSLIGAPGPDGRPAPQVVWCIDRPAAGALTHAG